CREVYVIVGRRRPGRKQLLRAFPDRRSPEPPQPEVRVYLDLGSPWSFLGFTQLGRIFAGRCRVVVVPILVGIVFREVGTPNLPSAALSETKRRYAADDLQRWAAFWGEPCTMPSFFPLRSVLPCRVCIIEPRAMGALFRAVWQQNKNVGEAAILCDVLNGAGFPGERLVNRAATDPHVKKQLAENTATALQRGVIGVPTYEVADKPSASSLLLFGQDRTDQLLDILAGWQPSPPNAAQQRALNKLQLFAHSSRL
ncbi:hypothetical protein PBRA_000505, partial [Plasmodiophora brassicae]